MQEQKRVSVKDIAARLHVSLSTVHKALTGKPGVSEARRQEILAAAEEMGYVVNDVAQSLSRKDIHIGIIMPSRWPEYFDQLKSGMAAQIESLQAHKVSGFFYTISSELSAGNTRQLLEWIVENEIDAILCCPSLYSISPSVIHALDQTGRPVFWVGGGVGNPLSVSDITIDAPLCGRLAADFLTCTTPSPVKAAVFTGSMGIDVHRGKTEAFSDRIRSAGGEVLAVCETGDDPDRAAAAVEELFRIHSGINAIYVSTSMSEPVCRYLAQHGLAGTVRLLGTDLFDVLKDYMKQGIMQATICQNQEQVGQAAVQCAYEYLSKRSSYGNTDWLPDRQILIRPTLLLRANIE